MSILPYIIPAAAASLLITAIILTVVRRRRYRCGGCIQVPDMLPDLEIPLKVLMEEEHIYSQCSIGVDEVAKRLGTNRSYLSAFINQRYGKTFSEYINDYRIDAAITLLRADKDMSLTEIAERCGYRSEATFYRNFKDKTGMTPGQLRNQS